MAPDLQDPLAASVDLTPRSTRDPSLSFTFDPHAKPPLQLLGATPSRQGPVVSDSTPALDIAYVDIAEPAASGCFSWLFGR